MNPKKGRWALICSGTDGEKMEKLARFFRGCREQGVETQGILVHAPQGWESLDLPKHWRAGYAEPKAGDEWFGILWDDQCPQSPKWDIGLISAVQPWSVVTSLDAHDGDWRKGAVVWGVECLRAGPMLSLANAEAILPGWAADAARAKCWRVETVSLPRRDPISNATPLYATGDGGAALSALMTRHGVRVCEPNYQGVSLLISMPTIRDPATDCVLSIMRTQQEMAQAGVPCVWSLERANADICLARSHIVAEFLRTQHTHLLMVDDDMTWEPSAVHRLFWADKPVVAVAGPKKSFPLRFAASKVGPDGKPSPLVMTPASGTAEVDHVGCAFMLIRRDVLERMAESYPDLKYTGSDGKVAHALFLQTIVNGQYLPEDFSFCQRWRALGGEIHICPDVPLGHIGQFEYKGDMVTSSMKSVAV